MARTSKRKSPNGKVNSENLSGAKVPRKAGVANQTAGKGLGARPLKPTRSIVNFAGKGRQ
jgi:hypothetical protein